MHLAGDPKRKGWKPARGWPMTICENENQDPGSTDCVAKIKLIDPSRTIKSCFYSCPHKYCDAWQILLNQHLAADCIQPSSSPFASPAFIMPKTNPTALPHWVNDYQQLNTNTVIDSHPLPWVDDILNDCAKGKFFSTIDITNSYFQMRMQPEDIPLTAVTTPFGLHECTVMPMGLWNTLSLPTMSNTCPLRSDRSNLPYLPWWYYHLVHWLVDSDNIFLTGAWSIEACQIVYQSKENEITLQGGRFFRSSHLWTGYWGQYNKGQ